MENESKFSEVISAAIESLNQQSWFQELRAKWDELDPQSRLYLRLGALAAVVLMFLITVLSSVISVHSLKSEINEKSELLTLIQTANDEMRRLHESNASLTSNAGGSWPDYFESTAMGTGLDKSSVTVTNAAAEPGSPNDAVKEAGYDIAIKHASIKQVVKIAYALESGNRPVRLDNLSIDTKADPTGYMDATLTVSAFTVSAGK